VAHILLIEDDPEVVAFTRTLFAGHNYSLAVATDGEVGLAEYMSRRPDLVLLDVFVPRLDGLRFAREIRERYPDDRTPIVVWTGAYEPDKIGDILETPHVLPKPVESSELLEVVRRALHVDDLQRTSDLRVLAVSSSAHALRELVRELRAEFEVHTATRWEEALALTDLRPYEAIVVDLGADPKDGAGLLRAVASRHKELGRIALLGDGQAEMGRELEQSGAAEACLGPDRRAGALADRLHAILG
jgi:DNA-binding response OmpR family regulator